MDIDLLRKRKKELKLTSREISDLSGIPLGTVQKVFSGATRSPRNDTLEALAKVLLVKERTPAQPHPADAGAQGGAAQGGCARLQQDVLPRARG